MYSIYRNNRRELLSKTAVISDLNIDNETFVTTTSTWDTGSKLNTKRSITLTANTTLTITNNINGQKGYLIVTQNSTGGFTLTLPSNSKGNTNIDKRVNAVTLLTFVFDGTNYIWNSITSSDDLYLKYTLIDHCFNNGYTPTFLGRFEFNGAYVFNISSTATNMGIIRLETGTNSNGIFGYRSSDSGGNSIILGNIAFTFRCIFRLPTLSDVTNSYFIILGFSNAFGGAASTTDNTVNGVYLYYDQTNANFRYITKNNSVTTNQDSGIVVSAGIFYSLTITINKLGTIAIFSVDNNTSYNATTNIPTGITKNTAVTLAIAKSLGTTIRQLDLDYIQLTYDAT